MVQFGGKYWFAEPPALTANLAVMAAATGVAERSRSLAGALAVTSTPTATAQLKKQGIGGSLAISTIAATGVVSNTHQSMAGELAVTAGAVGSALNVLLVGYAAGTTSATIPTHRVGDLILIFADRTSNTIASKPAAGGTVPAFLDIDTSPGTMGVSVRTAYAFATTTTHTTGTWTNATNVHVVVLRSVSNVTPIGGHATAGGTAVSRTAPAVAMATQEGSSALLHHIKPATTGSWGTPPAGYTVLIGAANASCLARKNVTTSDGQFAINYGTSSAYWGATVELRVARPVALSGVGTLPVTATVTGQARRNTYQNIGGSLAVTAAGSGGLNLPAAIVSAIDNVMDDLVSSTDATGCVFGTTGPQGYYAHAYGVANINDHVRIGSCTKMFVASAILQQVGLGNLALTDHLSQYVAGVANGNIITIDHLLSHRSGVYDFTHDNNVIDLMYNDPDAPYNPDDNLTIIRNGASQFAPGSQFAYSNSNYILLGYILAAVTSRSARDVIIDDVFEPLGLAETSWPTTPYLPTPYSPGYSSIPYLIVFRQTVETTNVNPNLTTTAGCFVSTIHDMLKWGAEHRDNTLLTSAMQTVRDTTWYDSSVLIPNQHASPIQSSKYGYATIQIGFWRGHAGSIDGFSSGIWHHFGNGTILAFAYNFMDFGSEHYMETFPALAEALYPGSTTAHVIMPAGATITITGGDAMPPEEEPSVYFVSAASTDVYGATTLSPMPTHEAGDMLVMLAWRATNPDPVGWQLIENADNIWIYRKWAHSSGETSGTWNAVSALICLVYRNAGGIGSTAVTSGSAGTMTFPALSSMDIANGASKVLMAGDSTSGSSLAETTTDGCPRRYKHEGSAHDLAMYDTDSGVTSFDGDSVSGATGYWDSASIELLTNPGFLFVGAGDYSNLHPQWIHSAALESRILAFVATYDNTGSVTSVIYDYNGANTAMTLVGSQPLNNNAANGTLYCYTTYDSVGGDKYIRVNHTLSSAVVANSIAYEKASVGEPVSVYGNGTSMSQGPLSTTPTQRLAHAFVWGGGQSVGTETGGHARWDSSAYNVSMALHDNSIDTTTFTSAITYSAAWAGMAVILAPA